MDQLNGKSVSFGLFFCIISFPVCLNQGQILYWNWKPVWDKGNLVNQLLLKLSKSWFISEQEARLLVLVQQSDVPTVLSSWIGKLCPLLPGDAPSCLLVSPPLWGCSFAAIRTETAEIPPNFLTPCVRKAAYKAHNVACFFPVVMCNLWLCVGLASGRFFVGTGIHSFCSVLPRG